MNKKLYMKDLDKLPTSIKELTFIQYNEILKIRLNVELSATDKLYNILSILTGISYETINESDLNDITALVERFSFINDNISLDDFEPILNFEFENEQYYIQSEVSKWNFRQYVDTEAIQTQYKDNIIDALPYFLAVLALRESEQYDNSDNTYIKGDKFKELPISIVFGVYSFFLRRRQLYIQTTTHSSIIEVQVNQLVQNIESSIQSGLGTYTLTAYLRVIYWNKIKSLTKISTKSSTISVLTLIKVKLKKLKESFYNKFIKTN